jgi:hypothetical protein
MNKWTKTGIISGIILSIVVIIKTFPFNKSKRLISENASTLRVKWKKTVDSRNIRKIHIGTIEKAYAPILFIQTFNKSITIEEFLVSDVGKFPSDWKAKKKEGEALYRVMVEGNNAFLRADVKSKAIPIGKSFSYNLKEYPILSWKWRLHKLPSGGDERFKNKGDSAGGIYLVFSGFYPIPKTLKYVWSSTLPSGTITKSPYTNRTLIKVVRSGEKQKGIWIEERVNAYKDYKKFFGGKPSKIRGIGIMSDSDNTNSWSIMDYDEIKIEKE